MSQRPLEADGGIDFMDVLLGSEEESSGAETVLEAEGAAEAAGEAGAEEVPRDPHGRPVTELSIEGGSCCLDRGIYATLGICACTRCSRVDEEEVYVPARDTLTDDSGPSPGPSQDEGVGQGSAQQSRRSRKREPTIEEPREVPVTSRRGASYFSSIIDWMVFRTLREGQWHASRPRQRPLAKTRTAQSDDSQLEFQCNTICFPDRNFCTQEQPDDMKMEVMRPRSRSSTTRETRYSAKGMRERRNLAAFCSDRPTASTSRSDNYPNERAAYIGQPTTSGSNVSNNRPDTSIAAAMDIPIHLYDDPARPRRIIGSIVREHQQKLAREAYLAGLKIELPPLKF